MPRTFTTDSGDILNIEDVTAMVTRHRMNYFYLENGDIYKSEHRNETDSTTERMRFWSALLNDKGDLE